MKIRKVCQTAKISDESLSVRVFVFWIFKKRADRFLWNFSWFTGVIFCRVSR